MIRNVLGCRKIEAVGDCIRQLASEGRAVPLFSDISTITTARIPINSFVHTESKLQCDLCCDNDLPVYNTQLLKVHAFLAFALCAVVPNFSTNLHRCCHTVLRRL